MRPPARQLSRHTKEIGRVAILVKEAKANGVVNREFSMSLRMAPAVTIVAAAMLLFSSETRTFAYEAGRALYEIGADWVMRGSLD